MLGVSIVTEGVSSVREEFYALQNADALCGFSGTRVLLTSRERIKTFKGIVPVPNN